VNPQARSIGAGSSMALDGLRLGAALTVLFAHAQDMWFPAEMHPPELPGEAAHAAVVVFFVLSGFVIAYTASARHRGLGEFMQARMSRLSSMMIPALILTAAVELAVLAQGNADLVSEFVRGAFGPRYVATALYLNEIWFFSAAPPADGALWSLSFEFWYYLIFGLWFCTGRGVRSWLFALAACLLAGPKILLMMPIWLMGVVACLVPPPPLKPIVRAAGIALALVAAAALVQTMPPRPFPIGQPPFFFANQFLTDWAVGLALAAALWLLPSKGPGVPTVMVKRLHALAELTFPIYVFHFPLLVGWRLVFETHVGDRVEYTVALISVLVISSILGLLLERQRPRWSRAFGRLFALLSAPFQKAKNT
jgi:peptidoglycan/LPS O-acetylase OafA/YrhL